MAANVDGTVQDLSDLQHELLGCEGLVQSLLLARAMPRLNKIPVLLAQRLQLRRSQEHRIMRAIVPALVLLALLTGCARHSTDPSASPRPDNKAACAAVGGKWKPITHHCDTD